MLLYTKIVDGEKKIFGAASGIPSASDTEVTYMNDEGTISLENGDVYLDDSNGGIVRASDGEAVDVYVGDINVIPGGKTAPSPAPTVESIAITSTPSKVEYNEGENLTLEGLVVTATYSDETTVEVTDYTTTPAKGAALTADDTKVVVSYEGKTAEFNITVTPEN